MKVNGKNYRSIWLAEDGVSVEIIDQNRLPFEFAIMRLERFEQATEAIKKMSVRGAPLIGATAAYGMFLGLQDKTTDRAIDEMAGQLINCRPTAVNLRWAVRRMQKCLFPLPESKRLAAARQEAGQICQEDVGSNAMIGLHGAKLLAELWKKKEKKEPVQVLTHCNAGWLATVDWGTALAPIYKARAMGVDVHVWVDETRPRNQGASLTAWELDAAGVPHHLLVDNAGGHLMQHGMVDCCIVGSDRTTAEGDVCNKIGTYLKALAAMDNKVPFYVALPGSTVDWRISNGLTEIPIEERDEDEVLRVWGKDEEGLRRSVAIAPDRTPAMNPAFDVTPARLVSALITERGVCPASRTGLLTLYPERA